MKKREVALVVPCLAAVLAGPTPHAQTSAPTPPVAAKRTHTTRIHGYTLTDDYFWLREKSNPEVVKYLEAENAYTETIMQPTKALQETLYKEMLGRIKQTDLSVPSRIGEYFYYSRTEEGKQYPIMCRRKAGTAAGGVKEAASAADAKVKEAASAADAKVKEAASAADAKVKEAANAADAKEEVLLDLNALAEGLKYLGLGAYVVSDDGNWLAYTTDTTGYRQYSLHIKDLRSGKTLGEDIERVGSVVWATDNKTVFYTTEDAVSKRSNKFFRHAVGAAASDLLFEEKDELFDVGVGRSLDRQAIFLASYAKTSTEFRYLPAGAPASAPRVVVPRQPGHEYDVDHYNGRFYITTNRSAKNFRVVTAPMDDPSEKNWQPFIDHNPAIKINGVTFFAGHIVVSEREGGLTQLRVMDPGTKQSYRIETDEPDFALSLSGNPEFNTTTVRFNYQSMVTPSSIYDFDMNTRKRTLLKQQEVLGGYDPAKYEAARIWAVARDGVKVPMSVVRKKGVALDGKAPLLLSAYGSYGASGAPTFSSSRLSLLDRGAIYVTAYIRGGGELGEEWRDAGRMMHKINTFNDFIDCADFLVKNRYTATDRLVIQGGSAGGLLMGAVSNMRPDLFKAVVSQVPFVDVINTMLDASLPLTTSEYLEWGNPNDKPAFDYMMKYSPYDNVKPVSYPSTLVQVSLNDSQVPYWEGAKIVARMRALKTDRSNPLILKTNMGAGHGGSSGRYDALRETSFTYAFILWQMGVPVPPATSSAPGR